MGDLPRGTRLVYAALVADFPDILADPNGDHAMAKDQASSSIGLTQPAKD